MYKRLPNNTQAQTSNTNKLRGYKTKDNERLPIVTPFTAHKRRYAALEEVPARDSNEDSCENTSPDDSTDHRLHENGVLDGAEGRLLDPHLTIKDLAHNVALLVLDNPRLVFVAVARAEGLETRLVMVELALCVAVCKQFPWSDVAVVHAMQHHTHSFIGRDQSGNAKHQTNGGYGTVTTAGLAQSEDDSRGKGQENQAHTKTPCEEHASGIAIADCPANKVGVCLAAESILNDSSNAAECRRVGGVSKRGEQNLPLPRREVELAWCVLSNVCCDDADNFGPEWLDGDYTDVSNE